MVREQYKEAIGVFEEGLALKAEVMDITHPLYTSGLENIAISKQALFLREESLDAYNKVLQIRTESCGPEHESTIKVRASRVMPLAELGRQEEALNDITYCLNITSRALGPTHQRTIEYTALLSHVYCTLGQWDKALYYGEYAARQTVQRHGIAHFQSVSFVYKQAWILQQMGRHAEANQLFASIGKDPHPMQQQQQQQAATQFTIGNPMLAGAQGGGEAAGQGLAGAFAMMAALQQAQQEQAAALGQHTAEGEHQEQQQAVQFGQGLGGMAQLIAIAHQMNATQMQQTQARK